MLDPYKVRLMTKAETIRQKDRELPRFIGMSRSAYIARGMLKSFIGVTIAFGLILLLYVFHAPPTEEASGVAPILGMIYIAVVLVWLVVSFLVYRWRYAVKTARLDEYHDCLRRLKRLR